MNRGTLLIKLSDGRVSEHPIEKSEVTIGRAPDNDIVIDDTSMSRYHVRVRIEGDRASILDALSTVGTFIGSKRVSSVTPSRLFEDQVARAGKIEIRFLPPRRVAEPIGSAIAEPRSSLASVAPALSLDGPPIQLALSGPDRPIEPGDLATAAMIIHNRGTVGDDLSIQVNGLPEGWVRLSRERVELLPHDQIKITLMFLPLPSRTLVGADYPFTVNVLSREYRIKTEVAGVLQVLTRQDLAVHLLPVRSRKIFQVQLENRGNAQVQCRLSGADDEQLLKYHFEQTSIKLLAGDLKSIELQVKPKARRIKKDRAERLVNFKVIAAIDQSTQPELRADGLLEIVAVRRLKFVLISVLLLALVIGGMWAYRNYCPQLTFCPSSAKASINSFTATPIEVPRGGTLVLSWDVTNADQVQIVQPDVQTVSKNGVATYKIDHTTSFTLRATNAGGVIERSITVNVK
jgi:hypothetical protein